MRMSLCTWSTVLLALCGATPLYAQSADAQPEGARAIAGEPEDANAGDADEGVADAADVAPVEDDVGEADSADATFTDEAAADDTFGDDDANEEPALGANDPAPPGDDEVDPVARIPENSIDETEHPPGKTPTVIDEGIDRFRAPVDRLTEQTLGSTSRPVGFDWRDAWVHVGVTGSELIERNNFGSFRLGTTVRKAFLDIMIEGQVTYVFVLGTESSRLLALTPYIQAGRPQRVEFDINVSYPMVEGVVTPLFDWFPPMQLVLNVTGGARYLLYPKVILGDRNWRSSSTYTDTATWRDVAASLASVQLTPEDQEVVGRDVLPGMQLDPARMHTLLGLTFDTYVQPGAFLSLRALLNIPVLQPISGTALGFWWEATVAVGYAF